jgi:hypothetical protein
MPDEGYIAWNGQLRFNQYKKYKKIVQWLLLMVPGKMPVFAL